MIPLNELLGKLGYDESPHYYNLTNDFDVPVETAHLFYAAIEANVSGIYLFETSPSVERGLLPTRPAVYVAEATNEEEAREIHRKLWNLSHVPFLIVCLPDQIRIYTGFDYSAEPPSDSREAGLLSKVDDSEVGYLERLAALLKHFTADAIDSKRIWQSEYAAQLDPQQRVDKRLLNNLDDLGKALVKRGLDDRVAHALIGKYVYFRYLRDRNIISTQWLNQQGIASEEVFTLEATVDGLEKLTRCLEESVNGRIFPIDFNRSGLSDEHVSWVASVFTGGKILRSEGTPEIVRQLHLPFRAYEFQYIPVETLSAIYEQFLSAGSSQKGVVYTPEVLADYLLSEVEWARPLELGAKILDPACGSGVFLVLAYRRLIEKELQRLGRRKLSPERLCEILLESIYGVEREDDACYVAEFSLILTLLHYAEPSSLHNLDFQFPELHDRRIFAGDFFDLESTIWQQEVKFDFVVGNPPWVRANRREQRFAYSWICKNQDDFPIGDRSVAEAFSWLVSEAVNPESVIGLVMPARSLFKMKSEGYRKAFFSRNHVRRITNFANLRRVLFDGRSEYPAATFVYQNSNEQDDTIIHYGPFSVNQITSEGESKPWVLTVNESEIQPISSRRAQEGEATLWKLALWGTPLDQRAVDYIQHRFSQTLDDLCSERNWEFEGYVELRDKESQDEIEHIPELRGKKRFLAQEMRASYFRLSVPSVALEEIPDDECYIRKRGGRAGLRVIAAPHIVISPSGKSYVAYSDEDFVLAPKHVGLSAPREDRDRLIAISIYLNSSLITYYLFFMAHEWGVYRQAKWTSTTEIRSILVPELTEGQVDTLVALHRDLVQTEEEEISRIASQLHKMTPRKLGLQENNSERGFLLSDLISSLAPKQQQEIERELSDLHSRLQKSIDEAVFDLLEIPEEILLLIYDFVQIRLPLDHPTAMPRVIRKPTKTELVDYARVLQTQLDNFARGRVHHKASVVESEELIQCTVRLVEEEAPIPNEECVEESELTTSHIFSDISDTLRQQISQWGYVQRGLRLFDRSNIYIFKSPRLIDWSRAQALNDATDIISRAVYKGLNREIN